MKIRQDFVTNSSSSSFVIIKLNDVSEQQVDEFINNNSKKLKTIAETVHKTYQQLAQEIKEYLLNFTGESIGNVQVVNYSAPDWMETIEFILYVLNKRPNWLKITNMLKS